MEAWATLYRTHFDAMTRHVGFLCGDPAATEDLVQEAFARALVKLPTFDGRAALSTWLHGIALNVVRNYWRGQRNTETAHKRFRRMQHVAADLGGTTRLEEIHAARRKAEVLYVVLDTLPDHLREAFVLRDLQGNTPAEAAALLGISPGNLSVRACRARERIRSSLEELGWLATPRKTS